VVGPETQVPDGNDRSVDNEGEWETMGVSYMPSKSIPVKFWLDWKGREPEGIVERFSAREKRREEEKNAWNS
jgi:hypothetical protein